MLGIDFVQQNQGNWMTPSDGFESTVQYLVTQQGEELNESKEICKAFQDHLAQLFAGISGPDIRRDIRKFITGLLRLSGPDAEYR